MEPIEIRKRELNKVSFGNANQVKDYARNENEIRKLLKVASNKLSIRKKKSMITFLTKKRGIMKVASSVLMAGKDFIVLKGGETIPIKSVLRVVPFS